MSLRIYYTCVFVKLPSKKLRNNKQIKKQTRYVYLDTLTVSRLERAWLADLGSHVEIESRFGLSHPWPISSTHFVLLMLSRSNHIHMTLNSQFSDNDIARTPGKSNRHFSAMQIGYYNFPFVELKQKHRALRSLHRVASHRTAPHRTLPYAKNSHKKPAPQGRRIHTKFFIITGTLTSEHQWYSAATTTRMTSQYCFN